MTTGEGKVSMTIMIWDRETQHWPIQYGFFFTIWKSHESNATL